MTVRYFYVEDDTAVLFGANGTALTALLIGVTDFIPLAKFSIPTDPMWLYFLGLIFAFLAKGMIQLINDDTLQREKLQNMRDLVTSAQKETDLTQEISKQLDDMWNFMEARYKTLFSPQGVMRISHVRALFFLASALCFLIGTARLIYLAGFLVAK